MQVVLVRPWTDAHGGGGCCSAPVRGGVVLERPVTPVHEHDAETLVLAEAYHRLRTELPQVDVQIVSSANTAYLLPSTFRQVRRRAGVLAALRDAARATTAGAVLVDGDRVGDVVALGPDGVVAQVRRRLEHTGA